MSWTGDKLRIQSRELTVQGTTSIQGSLDLTKGNLKVDGTTEFESINADDLTTTGNVSTTENVQARDVIATRDASVGQDLTVDGNASVNGDLTVANNATVSGNLSVSGTLTKAAYLYRSGDYNIPNNLWRNVYFNSIGYNNLNVTNNDSGIITVPETGYYLLKASTGVYSADLADNTKLVLRVNYTDVATSYFHDNKRWVACTHHVEWLGLMNAGETCYCRILARAGGGHGITVLDETVRFIIVKL